MAKSFLFFSFLLVSNFSWSQISTMSTPLGGATTQVVAAAAPINPPNTLKFTYDLAGNQTNREYVYIASGVWRQSNPAATKEVVTEEKLIESDIYSDILYYPNPVVSELFLKWKNNDADFVDRIELYSLSGQLVKSMSNIKNSEETTIDFQSLPSGYYNLLLIYNSGQAKDLKIIKK